MLHLCMREVLSRLENPLENGDQHYIEIEALMKSEQMPDGVCAVVLNKLQTILRFCSQKMMIGRFSLSQTEHSVATRQECRHFDRMKLTSTFHVSRSKFQAGPNTRIYF